MYGKLARSAAEYYVKFGEVLVMPAQLPLEMMRQRAAYVGIYDKTGHRMRSLYGSALPRYSTLAEEIVMNTTHALSFGNIGTIRRSDLPSLVYSVGLLGPLQRVSDTSHLDPECFGLSIRSDRGKSALLLPQRTGIETADDQIACALRESGINLRNEIVTMYRFTVEYDDG
jgi:AMMECR1 domain-containing protein